MTKTALRTVGVQKGGCQINYSLDLTISLLSMCSREIHMHRSLCTRMEGVNNERERVSEYRWIILGVPASWEAKWDLNTRNIPQMAQAHHIIGYRTQKRLHTTGHRVQNSSGIPHCGHRPRNSIETSHSGKKLREFTWNKDDQLFHRSHPLVTDSYKHLRDLTWDTQTHQGPSTLWQKPQTAHIPDSMDTDPKTAQRPHHLEYT